MPGICPGMPGHMPCCQPRFHTFCRQSDTEELLEDEDEEEDSAEPRLFFFFFFFFLAFSTAPALPKADGSQP
jgi:hypothetical protein